MIILLMFVLLLSNSGSTVGDPHITTYDGHTYDYNGIGEYWLIKSSALSVQVRTVQAKDNKGGLVNASVFGAFAVQIPQKLNQNMTDKVFLRMVSDASEFSKQIGLRTL